MPAAHALIVVFALLLAGCGAKASGPPEIVVDRTVCSHCQMLISELRYAAAYQVADNEARVFDDIGCLLDAIRGEAGIPEHVWFQDGGGGGWIDGTAATFVDAPRVRTPMGGGILAFADAAVAERRARTLEGNVVRTLLELMTRKGETR